jgi:hypothetical protein
MEKIILDYPRKKLNWIPLTKIERLDNDKQHVLYSYNDKDYKHICFRDIFNRGVEEADVLEICLNPVKNRYATRYTNLKKYVRHLNKLYSGAKISIFYEKSTVVPNHYGIWLRIFFSKNYPVAVLKDLCTRIRFLHEYPYQAFMDDLLSVKGFKLEDIENHVSKLDGYAVNTGHYLFYDYRSKIKTYKNYEERVLRAINDFIDMEDEVSAKSLHKVLNEIKNENN